ncbi:MAG: hypothetical protein LBQ97_02605 [Fusobacteriaceae bacterium]|jgi:hypothetical protein|nr:hypothetical protein [Fusobacteriaceae bacterium]
MARVNDNEFMFIDEEGELQRVPLPVSLRAKAIQEAENAIMDDIAELMAGLVDIVTENGVETEIPVVFNYLHGWHWQMSGQEKIAAKEAGFDVTDDFYEKKVPYILIRPQTIKNKPEKTVMFQVMIVIDKANPVGYYLLMEAVNLILDYYDTNFVHDLYWVDAENMSGLWNSHATIGPYWGYDIMIPVTLPQQPMGTIMARDFNL